MRSLFTALLPAPFADDVDATLVEDAIQACRRDALEAVSFQLATCSDLLAAQHTLQQMLDELDTLELAEWNGRWLASEG